MGRFRRRSISRTRIRSAIWITFLRPEGKKESSTRCVTASLSDRRIRHWCCGRSDKSPNHRGTENHGERLQMNVLNSTIGEGFARRYEELGEKVDELAGALSNQQFWTKPFSFGNSFGHLVLHLTGNLNYYIGAQIANTGYVRDREREFSASAPPAKEEALKQLDAAVAMVMETVRGQSSADWGRAYSAVGTNCSSRLDIVMQCAAHIQHHIGQIIYLGFALQPHESR